jgi:chromosome segregation ATPase
MDTKPILDVSNYSLLNKIYEKLNNLELKIDDVNNDVSNIKYTLSSIDSNIRGLSQSIENIEIDIKLEKMKSNEKLLDKKEGIKEAIDMFSKFNKLDVIKDAVAVEDEFMRLLSMFPIKSSASSITEIIEAPHVPPYAGLDCPLD